MGKSAINPAVVGKHSTDIAALKNGLGIVEDGDTATHTIAQGQYVIWQGALYTADAAIASGTALAASGGNKNLTAVPNGGLNALYSKMPVLLWTNPNVSATGEATIASGIDFKGFTLFAVRAKLHISVSKYATYLVSIGDPTQMFYATDSQTQNANVWFRYIAINNGNIYVENAKRGDGTNNTSALIPEALYGIM